MDESKTVRSVDVQESSSETLYVKQLEDVAAMRASLLRCNKNDLTSVRTTIQNITVMRVYHQISRIIRYMDIMDQIEDKMYNSIYSNLQTMDEDDPTTWITLMKMQAQLQETMISSQKLLDPYLNSELFNSIQIVDTQQPESFAQMMLKSDTREKLRTSAASILAAIDSADTSEVK